MSDKEWEILEPYVAQGAIGRPRKHNIRTIINAIRYIMRGGCQWSKRFSSMENDV
ncbi:transposase [Wolbachia endosymbiont (group A) of Myopa testacea]|uniref:transposase n=1 Tax=Wolbachia endosymbiont (group A) of Myopa testacea TaxID=3066148 RepID=UPI00397DD26E